MKCALYATEEVLAAIEAGMLAGDSQKVLAGRLGVSQPTVQRLIKRCFVWKLVRR